MYCSWVVKVGRLTDHHSPYVDEDEERNVGEFLQRKDEWKDVVWYTLRESVHWMESMAGERRGHNPLVVWLVNFLVDHGMM